VSPSVLDGLIEALYKYAKISKIRHNYRENGVLNRMKAYAIVLFMFFSLYIFENYSIYGWALVWEKYDGNLVLYIWCSTSPTAL
jgi:hypothetical protein